MSSLRLKTWVVTAVVVLSNVLGNSCLSWGMKQRAAAGSSPLACVAAVFTPWVALGIALLILWLLARMALLSWADLSFVVPATAATFVVETLVGGYILRERISARRWLGTVLVTWGVVLIGL